MFKNIKKMDAFRLHLLREAIQTFAATLIWTAMMIYQIEVAGLSPLQLVLIGTTMEITVFLFEIPTGVVADVYSRRLSVIISYFIIGIAYIMQGLFPVFEVFVLANVVWGIGWTFTSGAYDAWLVDEIGQERAGDAFLRGTQIARFAAIIGIIGSVLLGSISLHLPILIGGFITMMMTPLLAILMAETGFQPTPREDRSPQSTFQAMTDTFKDGIRLIRGRPMLISILGISFFIGLYSEGWDRLWQAHMIESIGYNVPTFIALPVIAWFGLFRIADMILSILGAEFLRKRIDTTAGAALNNALFVMIAGMCIAILVYGLAGNFIVAILAYFVFTTLRGLIHPIFVAWSNMHIESRVRATVLSVQSQTDAIGQIAGGPPLGLIGQISLQAAFVGSSLLLSPALVLLRRAKRKEKTIEAV